MLHPEAVRTNRDKRRTYLAFVKTLVEKGLASVTTGGGARVSSETVVQNFDLAPQDWQMNLPRVNPDFLARFNMGDDPNNVLKPKPVVTDDAGQSVVLGGFASAADLKAVLHQAEACRRRCEGITDVPSAELGAMHRPPQPTVDKQVIIDHYHLTSAQKVTGTVDQDVAAKNAVAQPYRSIPQDTTNAQPPSKKPRR